MAGRGAFVGRRRVLQRVFRAFAEVDSGSGGSCGVLLHGMGNLGKSSVAAWIASRLQRHQTVVVFERYDALAVLDGLMDAVPTLRRQGFRDEWREAVRQDGDRLAEALEALLDLLEHHHDGQQAAAPLLLTSRYRFTLPDDRSNDLAERLITVPLQPMSDTDRLKQWDAALRLLTTKAPADTVELRRLMLQAERAMAAVGQKAGVADAAAATDRLLGLGLVDDFGEIDGEASAAVNPLARPLCEPLAESERPALADAALPDLARVWRTESGAVPGDARALVLCRLALCSPMPAPELLDRAATAAARWLFSSLHDARRAKADGV